MPRRPSPREPRPRLARLLTRTLIVLAGGWLVSLICIAGWSRRSSTDTADAIVVLGAAQYGGRPSPVLRSRLDHALALYQTKRAPLVVLTGGRRPGDEISEAAAGRRYLLRRGVPSEMMLMEPAGRTSLASMQGAADVLLARRDSLQPNADTRPSVLLVSDPFHMLRLDILARLHGLTPHASPTRTSPINANRTVLEYMLRESVALPADLVLMVWLKMTGRRVED